MPSRNVVREFAETSFYHVYNRGVERRLIFLDEEDHIVFLGMLKKYLSGENHNRNNRHNFDRLDGEVELLAYCLMPNHFHLLLYQNTADGIVKLMRRLITGYVMYFNRKYGRVGSLFQGTYKASRINAETYLQHISRYIHMNPKDYRAWPYSSLAYYLGDKKRPAWLKTDPILAIFDNDADEYLAFLKDYEDEKRLHELLKYQLADGADL